MTADRLSEDDLIARYFAPLAGEGGLGLRDDAARIAPPQGCEIVLTVDGLVAGVHFFPDDPPETVARKALRVNLSDLAAKGAAPLGFLLTLALPRDWRPDWLAAFARSLGDDSQAFACPLLGGDTVSTPGPLTLSITALGSVPAGRMVPRDGARAGDALYVSGTIGDAALGLRIRTAGLPASGETEEADRKFKNPHPEEPRSGVSKDGGGKTRGLCHPSRRACGAPQDEDSNCPPGSEGSRSGSAFLLERYLVPQPRLGLAGALRDHASGAMDVSDGLVGDLTKMLRVSGVGGDVDVARVPLSAPAQAVIAADPRLLETALTGGDDYEILASVPPGATASFESAAQAAGIPVARIGTVAAGQGAPTFRDGRGAPMSFARGSYSHF